MLLAGQDFDALKKARRCARFQARAAPDSVELLDQATLAEIESQNVVAKLEGSDPKLKDEYVVYTAHWDHLGGDPK